MRRTKRNANGQNIRTKNGVLHVESQQHTGCYHSISSVRTLQGANVFSNDRTYVPRGLTAWFSVESESFGTPYLRGKDVKGAIMIRFVTFAYHSFNCANSSLASSHTASKYIRTCGGYLRCVCVGGKIVGPPYQFPMKSAGLALLLLF